MEPDPTSSTTECTQASLRQLEAETKEAFRTISDKHGNLHALYSQLYSQMIEDMQKDIAETEDEQAAVRRVQRPQKKKRKQCH